MAYVTVSLWEHVIDRDVWAKAVSFGNSPSDCVEGDNFVEVTIHDIGDDIMEGAAILLGTFYPSDLDSIDVNGLGVYRYTIAEDNLMSSCDNDVTFISGTVESDDLDLLVTFLKHLL